MATNPDQSEETTNSTATELQPTLGLWSAVMVVIGGVIGSGIFFIPDTVSNRLHGNVALILGMWVLCGIVNLCGALSLAELSAMMPHSGGMYVFLREAYGRWCSFTWSWTEFWVIRASAIAALGVAITLSLHEMFTLNNYYFSEEQWRINEKIIACGVILFLAVINVIGVRWAAAMQNITTVLKVIFILLLSSLPFLFASNQTGAPATVKEFESTQELSTALILSIMGIMWAYDGWGNVTVIAQEIKNPRRVIPLALIIGLLLLILIYVGANIAYLKLTGTTSTYENYSVPAAFGAGVSSLIPGADEVLGAKLMLMLVIISVFGALNQLILTGPRVFYAMGHDHPKFSVMKHVDPRTKTPIIAIGAICIWAIFLVMIGDLYQNPSKPFERLFDVLIAYCVFGGSIFYFLAIMAVIVMRKKRPNQQRPYKALGYPITPILFLLFYTLLLGGLLFNKPLQSFIGLAFISVGFIVYRWTETKKASIRKER